MQILGFSKAPYDDYTSSNSMSENIRKIRQNRKARRGYRRSLSPSDLVPTELGTTKSHIVGPGGIEFEDIVGSPKTVNDHEALYPPEEGQIIQTVSVHQQSEGPPKIELRNSFRNSFNKGSTFSLSNFRIPE